MPRPLEVELLEVELLEVELLGRASRGRASGFRCLVLLKVRSGKVRQGHLNWVQGLGFRV